MSGRRLKENVDTVRDALLKSDSVIKINNKIIPKTSILWTEIVDKFHLKISPKTLYNRALLLFPNYNTTDTVQYIHNNSSDNSDNSDNTISSYEEEKGNIKTNSAPRHFQILIKKEEWLLMCPEMSEHKRIISTGTAKKVYRRNILKLKKGVWTDIIHKKLYCAMKLPCPFSFKYNYIQSSSTITHTINIKAKCKECLAVLYLKSEDINITTEINEYTLFNGRLIGEPEKYSHLKKRRLAGPFRTNITSQLLVEGKSASVLRKSMAKTQELFDEESPNLPSLNVLRKAKSDEKNRNRINVDPVQALYMMAQKNPFSFIIHNLGLYKFYVHFWTPDQTRIYNEYNRRSDFTSICLDATGGVVRKINRENNLSGNIFLYSIVVKIPRESEGQIPVCQMLSEMHNTNCILYWLNEWQRLGAKLPHEIVSDDSPALISAACKSFAGLSGTYEYIDACFKILSEKKNLNLSCFIRIDVAHAIKSISTWREINPNITKRRIREFYIRAMAQLILASDLLTFKTTLEHIFIVALSEYEGFSVTRPGTKIACEVSKQELINRFAYGSEHNLIEQVNIHTEEQSTKDELTIDEEDSKNTGVKNWIDNILIEATSKVDTDGIGDRDNIMYLPVIATKIKKFCYK